MRKRGYRTFSLLCMLCLISLACSMEPEPIVLSNGIPVDTLEKWSDWATSTGVGLWKNDESRRIEVVRTNTYGGEADLMPPFFNANFLASYGDTIYIADGSQEALIAMSSSGDQLWTTGQVGEGPGSFAMIGSIDRYADVIAVCNNSNNRLDFFSIDGTCLSSIPVSGPQNVVLLSDTTGLVASKSQPGGSIHFFHRYTGIERSFGEGDWTMFPGNFPRRDLFIAYHPMGRVACMSQFEDNLFIYDFETGEVLHSGTRDLPASSSGSTEEVFYTLYAPLFLGPDSMINVPIPNIMNNGHYMGSGGTFHTPVTFVDRYNWDGDYLDTYLLPDSVLGVVIFSEELGFIAAQWGTSEIHRYEMP